MIQAENVCFQAGEFLLKDLSLQVQKGEYFVLLGPPGSGKTLFLEALCGLGKLGSGRILIDGNDVAGLEPRLRMIGYVPQDYALFPHRCVEGNIRFGLEAEGLPDHEINRLVRRIADQLRIRHLLNRQIEGLSGGERQQVALGRALVIQPKVLLLDEPVSALDESTREDVCSELKRIHGALGITTIHVCHQLQEAFSVADRAGILKQGTLQQIGTMKELTQRPCNRFVAEFMRCRNLIPGRASGPPVHYDKTEIEVGNHRFMIPGRFNGNILLVIRPERIWLESKYSTSTDSMIRFPVVIREIADLGVYVRLDLEASFPLTLHTTREEIAGLELAPGIEAIALIRPENIHIISDSPANL